MSRLGTEKSFIEFNQHWNEQAKHTCFDFIPYDFVGRLETIEPDLEKLKQYVGTNNNNRKSSNATNASALLNNSYDAETMNIIETIYYNYFNTFGYEIGKLPS